MPDADAGRDAQPLAPTAVVLTGPPPRLRARRSPWRNPRLRTRTLLRGSSRKEIMACLNQCSASTGRIAGYDAANHSAGARCIGRSTSTLGRVSLMSVRMRAVLVGAILALVVAPAAEAAKSKKKLGDFRLVSLKVSKKTVTAGSTVVASGRVAEPQGPPRPDRAVTYSLRKGKTSKSGRRLGVRQHQAHEGRQVPQVLRAPARRLHGEAGHVLPDRLRPPRQRHAQGRVRPQAAQGQGQAAARPARRRPSTRATPRASSATRSRPPGMLNHLKALQRDRRRATAATAPPASRATAPRVQYVLDAAARRGLQPDDAGRSTS